MFIQNIYKIGLLKSYTDRGNNTRTAAFKKDSKAVALIGEMSLCSSLLTIIIIPGFTYPVRSQVRI